MKQIAFPFIIVSIVLTGLVLSTASIAARTGIGEGELLRSGHTVDYDCRAAVPGSVASDEGQPMQLAAKAGGCGVASDGSCLSPGSSCATSGKKKGTSGVCTTVTNKRKKVSCACVK